MDSVPQPRIYVLAGVNGAGKSSIAGATFRQDGGEYYNPDEAARKLRIDDPLLSQANANGAAWRQGVRLLERAIEERLDYAFETTLGGSTITRLLAQAASQGIEVYVWYAGLSSPELHIARVRARVRRGGHHIAAGNIYRRYEHSRLNLIDLLPSLTGLRLFDNSADADPAVGETPIPLLLLHMERRKILNASEIKDTPTWAKLIVAAAFKLCSG